MFSLNTQTISKVKQGEEKTSENFARSLFEYNFKLDHLLQNASRMRERCFLTSELSHLNGNLAPLAASASTTPSLQSHIEEVSSLLRKHNNLLEFHREFSKKGSKEHKKSAVDVDKSLEFIGPLSQGFEDISAMYSQQMDGLKQLWPQLCRLELPKKFQSPKQSEDGIDYSSIAEYVSWREWFSSNVAPEVQRVNNALHLLLEALEEEEKVREKHSAKIDQGRVLAQRALTSIAECKLKGNLEVERMAIGKLCSKLLQIYYQTNSLALVSLRHNLQQAWLSTNRHVLYQRLFVTDPSEDFFSVDVQEQAKLSDYVIVESEKLSFRASDVHMAVRKSEISKGMSKHKRRAVHKMKEEDAGEESAQEERRLVENASKCLLFVYQYLSSKVLLFFHRQLALLAEADSHPLIRSVSNFGYDKESFTLFAEIPLHYLNSDSEHLSVLTWGERTSPSPEMICFVTKGLFQALSHLHQRSIVHGNLGDHAIFVHTKTCVPYISHFELLNDMEGISWSDNPKSPPELVHDSSAIYTPLCDVWNLAVVLFELHFNCEFSSNMIDEDTGELMVPTLFQEDTGLVMDLLRHLLCVDPSKRYTCFEALMHPYFNRFELEQNSIFSRIRKARRQDITKEIAIADWSIKNIIDVWSKLEGKERFLSL